ncbi:DNA polymerase Y family protein [soil metagenome]
MGECSVPRGGGWRPGARWAKGELENHRPGEGNHEVVEGAGGKRSARGKPPSAMPRMVPLPVPGRSFPIVTSQKTGSQNLIAAASPAAQSLGLTPGMAITQARAQVPELAIHPADPEGDHADLVRLAVALARRWCPVVALSGADGLFLDMTGTAHLFGGEARMAARIVRLLARLGVTARMAVADTAGAAWAAARHSLPAISILPPATQATALAPLPIAALRIEDRATELLRRLGIDTIGQLAALPRAPLVRRFGKPLVQRLDQALGTVSEPLDPVIPPEHLFVAQRFAEPIATAEAIAHWLGTLVPPLVEALAETRLGARAIELIAERVDGVPQRIRIGLARPSRDGAHILRLLLRRIEDVEPGFGIDAITLHVRRADPLGAQPIVERLDEESTPDLAPLVDTLATRIGIGRLWRTRPVESDVPERSVARIGMLDLAARPEVRLKLDDVRQLDRNDSLPGWHPDWPRPVRLLHRPEQLDHVIAEMPDRPPRRFTWRGTAHRVVRADGPERIHGEWWRHQAELHSVRDYFQVEDEVGRRFWLFRRGDGVIAESGDLRWYLHGVFG